MRSVVNEHIHVLTFSNSHTVSTQNGESAQEQLEVIRSLLQSPHSVLSYTYSKASGRFVLPITSLQRDDMIYEEQQRLEDDLRGSSHEI
jgi:hypothetical protein